MRKIRETRLKTGPSLMRIELSDKSCQRLIFLAINKIFLLLLLFLFWIALWERARALQSVSKNQLAKSPKITIKLTICPSIREFFGARGGLLSCCCFSCLRFFRIQTQRLASILTAISIRWPIVEHLELRREEFWICWAFHSVSISKTIFHPDPFKQKYAFFQAKNREDPNGHLIY